MLKQFGNTSTKPKLAILINHNSTLIEHSLHHSNSLFGHCNFHASLLLQSVHKPNPLWLPLNFKLFFEKLVGSMGFDPYYTKTMKLREDENSFEP